MVEKVKGFNHYYIHRDGYLFKRYGGKEIIIPIKLKKGVPKVQLGNQNVNFVFLMQEYFGDKYISINETSQYRFKFKLKDGKIPFESIRIVRFNTKKFTHLKEQDNIHIQRFKCYEKAVSANSRVLNISVISELDVYNTLLRTNFNCFYCNQKLDYKTWELDHVMPLSMNGLNVPENITASCKRCNRMKSNMQIIEFVHKCKMIADNFKDSEFLNEFTFSLKGQKQQ